MTGSERRQQIESICDAALNLSAAERAAYLTRACGGDGTLRAEVESLLAHASGAEHFLEIPVGAIVASVATRTDAQAVGPGTKLGTFELLAPLGAGGQGRVYRARDTQLHRDVAVKMLTGPASDDAGTREALLREARRAARLSHSGICQVFHVGDSPHGPFMVMELVDGQTLRDLLRAGPMSTDRVCRIGAEIARALDHSHAHGIVHRDLKSANVMLTRDGHVKVLDFGIAATLPDDGLERTLSMMPDQEIAGIAGTVPYMAPEVLRGSAASVASDVWALGVVPMR